MDDTVKLLAEIAVATEPLAADPDHILYCRCCYGYDLTGAGVQHKESCPWWRLKQMASEASEVEG